MTPAAFRKLALTLDAAVESSHMGHPDFRVGGKVFATLGYPDDAFAMIALTPDEQAQMIAAAPKAFRKVKGGWGDKGATQVILREARTPAVRAALKMAWERRRAGQRE